MYKYDAKMNTFNVLSTLCFHIGTVYIFYTHIIINYNQF